jgi:aminoglycoside/choline kinase family phosphotransferase
MNASNGISTELMREASTLALEAGMPELASRASLVPIAEGGSDRRFYRLSGGGRTAVLLVQPGGGRELDSYVDIARFLSRHGIGAPEIYAVGKADGAVLMEDLGDIHLEDALTTASADEMLAYYRGALDMLVELETAITDGMMREGLLQNVLFDEKTLLGETEYFIREFIDGYCPVSIPPSWESERRLLAQRLARENPVFMHRDFQSRNIMIVEGRLRLLDFQTAHRGPGIYDAASLLKDPYHPVPAAPRRRLLEEFHAKLAGRGARGNEPFDVFHEIFTLAGIQRNLQALAAFAKLGRRKGKAKFLEFVPNGLDLLEEGIAEAGRFPGLEKMVLAVREMLRRSS